MERFRFVVIFHFTRGRLTGWLASSSSPFYGAPRFPFYVPHTPHFCGVAFICWPWGGGGMVAALFPCFHPVLCSYRLAYLGYTGVLFGSISVLSYPCVPWLTIGFVSLPHRSGSKDFQTSMSLSSHGTHHHHQKLRHSLRRPPHRPLKPSLNNPASSKNPTPKILPVHLDRMPAVSASSPSLV